MAALTRHRLTEGILSLGGVGALLVGMSMVDDTFRGHLAGVTGEPSNALALTRVHMHRVARLVMETAGDQANERLPLVFFSLAALALLAFMLRT